MQDFYLNLVNLVEDKSVFYTAFKGSKFRCWAFVVQTSIMCGISMLSLKLKALVYLKLILPMAVQVNNNLQSVCFVLHQFVLSWRNKTAIFFLFVSKTSKFYDFLKSVLVYLYSIKSLGTFFSHILHIILVLTT